MWYIWTCRQPILGRILRKRILRFPFDNTKAIVCARLDSRPQRSEDRFANRLTVYIVTDRDYVIVRGFGRKTRVLHKFERTLRLSGRFFIR